MWLNSPLVVGDDVGSSVDFRSNFPHSTSSTVLAPVFFFSLCWKICCVVVRGGLRVQTVEHYNRFFRLVDDDDDDDELPIPFHH